MLRPLIAGALLAWALASTSLSGAQQADVQKPPPTAPTELGLPLTFDGPPPPIPPEVIARDPSGRATVRAVGLDSSLQIDGRLDEGVYATVPSVSGFIQNEPREGEPSEAKTDVWIFFDSENVYVVARCWETHPERLVATEMRRDNVRIVRDDNFAWSFDTFYDRRNALLFEVSAIGGRIDAQVTDERQVNMDWNPVWEVAVGRFEGGWTMEAALPFTSLRYRPGETQVWGFQARRVSRWRNEISYLTPISASQGLTGHFRSSLAATVVGLKAPGGSRNVEIKPYVISGLTTDTVVQPRLANDVSGALGLDVKYGITQNLTADFTVNPDFAQVEADQQQVNLTRFSLFFPEKREFFLENQGLFAFGGAGTGPRGGGGDTPLVFYSRQIGLNAGRAVSLDAGGRVTGRVGAFSVGVLNIQASDDPAADLAPTNFSVVRVKRDLLRRSSVGAIFTGRSVGQQGTGANEAYGVDGTFGFFNDLTINTYWARTRTGGVTDDDISYRGQLNYNGDRYGLVLERLRVGENFNPEVGFVRRDDMRRSYAEARFSPRPQAITFIRKLFWTGKVDYIEDGAGRVETREWTGEFRTEFENSDQFSLSYVSSYEFLSEPFRISSDVTLPVGSYDFSTVKAGFNFGPQRLTSGNLAVEHGTFFGGDKTAFSATNGRLSLSPQFSIEPIYSVNWVDLPEGSFTTHLPGSRVTYTVTPLMFTSALVQYNSSINSVSANVRFRWEYQPGSELFVVLNEDRDTRSHGFPSLANRSLIVKVNRLFRF